MSTVNAEHAFPEKEVKLLSGERVVIQPWSLTKGRLMRKRITDALASLQKARGKKQGLDFSNLGALVAALEDDVYHIVRDTIEKDDAWMEENLKYEDLFTLAQAVIETCLFRESDGGGALGKILGAAGGLAGQTDVGVPPEMAARLEEVRAMARGESPTPPKSTSA